MDHRIECRACATFLKDNFKNLTVSFAGQLLGILQEPRDNCTDHVADIFRRSNNNNGEGNLTYNHTPSALGRVEEILYSRVVVVMCFIGLVGNVLNLYVLVPRGLKYASGRMEKFAYSGLIALALSNMSFCLTTIPYGFLGKEKIYTEMTFALLFHVYNNAIINAFIFASTWLTVTLAVGRYIAVCYPLKAREAIGMTCAKRSICTVTVICVLFNIPRFFTYSIKSFYCADGTLLHIQYYGYLAMNKTFYITYNWMYFVLGIVVPALILIFSNSYLIHALRMSRATQNRIRATKVKQDTSNHMTLTLIIIILMYIVLVSPAEMINFLMQHGPSVSQNPSHSDAYNFAVSIVNTLQAFNFAFSFVPYCAINAHFRKMVARMLRGSCLSKTRHSPTADSFVEYSYNNSLDHQHTQLHDI